MAVTHSATNFFARQTRARKNRRIQVILFAAAVAAIVAATTAALRLAWFLFLQTYTHTALDPGGQGWHQKLSGFTFFDPAFFIFTGTLIVMIIIGAGVYKTYTLQGGGPAVAEMLGGRRIKADTDNQNERRLINVVEEMAIAAGIPVPLVYVMDSEYNITAFAAGHTHSDAPVTVTRGALDKLSRDELQGVIAHEFSHILNGDMRLNIQMIGILFGILFLGIAGRKFLSTGRVSARAGIPALAVGVFLLVIGYGGSFLGRLIQCAITRQQELLADATAVQFTRNPPGLAGALKKIGGSTFGALIRSPAAALAGHLFFAESQSVLLFDFLATHPPLTERIRLLEPSFDGKFITVKDERQTPHPKYTTPHWGTTYNIPHGSVLLSVAAADVINRVGNPGPEHITQGQAILRSLPTDIRKSIKTPVGAACVIYALLMDGSDELRSAQAAALKHSSVVQGEVARIVQMCGDLADLKPEYKLPLIELAMPALSGLSIMERKNFLLIVHSLINADARVTLFELSVQWLLTRHLAPSARQSGGDAFFSFGQVGLHAAVLLAALANTGNRSSRAGAEAAFRAGLDRIPELAARKLDFSYEEDFSYIKVNNALNRLSASSFKIKEAVIDACAHCAFADKKVTVEEKELLRVIALALQCPLPPFVETWPGAR